jgi:hypothetical protein
MPKAGKNSDGVFPDFWQYTGPNPAQNLIALTSWEEKYA